MISKIRLGGSIAVRYVRVRLDLRRVPLPSLVDRYSALPPSPRRYQVGTLRRGVDRLLRLPGRPLRCLPRALVLYSLVAQQGQDARLVIGLPTRGESARAHAWVEIGGVDVGPSPGRDGHDPMAAYPSGDGQEQPDAPGDEDDEGGDR